MVNACPPPRTVDTPLTPEVVLSLRAGEWIALTGEMFLARDATLRALVEVLEQADKVPFTLEGAVIFHAGPTPPPSGNAVGAVGPTTSARVDRFIQPLLERGIAATVGKGDRTLRGMQLHMQYKAVYLVACGGAAAYLRGFVTDMKLLAYPELGPQALRRIEVKSFPLLVAYDTMGGNVFKRRTVWNKK